MLSLLKLLGFTLVFIRFSYWIGSSLPLGEENWQSILLAQCIEGLLLFFFFTQLVGYSFLPISESTVVSTLGFILIVLGVTGAFVAKNQLGNAWVYASVYKIVPKQKLITRGLYHLVRHPIYTSIVVSYVGVELLASSWLFVSILFLFIPFYFQAKKEERILQNHFGKKFEKYKQATKMFVPYLL